MMGPRIDPKPDGQWSFASSRFHPFAQCGQGHYGEVQVRCEGREQVRVLGRGGVVGVDRWQFEDQVTRVN